MNDTVMEKVMDALDNDEHANLLHETTDTIEEKKHTILLNLQLPPKTHLKYLNTLKSYQFVDELPDMKYGSYIRWINITNVENFKLTNGGIVCEIKIGEHGILIVCKNNMNRFFQLNMNENLIFRKMTNQELVLLSALDYISKKT